MRNTIFFLLFLIEMVVVLLSCTMSAIAVKQCPDCGHTQVPYPLSTRPDCGDQSYKIRCVSGTLFFDALNSSSYPVTSINPITQRLIVRPPGFLKNECVSEDFKSEGIHLDTNFPFNITSSNSVVLMNCSTQVYETSLICTPPNLCYKYIKGNAIANKDCGPSSHASSICCSIKTGGSGTAYKIRLQKDRCAAYLSFVYLDETLPVNKWPEPGVEIEWKQPKEPVCNVTVDCRDLAFSACSPDPVSGGFIKRCLCNSGFQWDAINGMCHNVKCQSGRSCKRMRKTPLIGGLAFAAVMLIISGILIKILVSKKRHRIKREARQSLTRVREDILNAHNSGKSAKIFTGKDITRATNNFSKDNLLGAGGFGEVFKDILDEGTITAVKRAKLGNIKGIDQILNEVRILCQVNHRSLVRLLGCCVELRQPLLIYEYVPNGTLFDHLHGISSHDHVKWRPRLKIAHQIAEGIAYLHFSAVPRIYHRDIKSSNILLDNELNAKVADFGLSRLAVSESSHITTCAQGTLGYLDPEYYLNFQLTDKSDVYSFGVVLLELLTSKKAIDFNREEEDVNLVVLIKRVLKEERFMDVVDPMLKEGASKLELDTMKALGSLAAACLDERRNDRPTMKEAADEIEYIISIVTGFKGEVISEV